MNVRRAGRTSCVAAGAALLLLPWILLADDERKPRRPSLLDQVVRMIAERISEDSSTEKTPATYRKELSAKEPALRREAVRALGQPGHPEVVQELLPLLKDPVAEVRTFTALAFAKIGLGAQAAVPALLEATKDSDTSVRAAAFAALGSLNPQAEAALPVYRLGMEDAQPLVRQSAILAAGGLGAKATPLQQRIETHLKDNDRDVKVAAIFALAQLGPAGAASTGLIKPLMGDADPYLKLEAAAAVWNLKRAPECLKTMESFLSNNDLKLREFAQLRLTNAFRTVAQADLKQAIGLLKETDSNALKKVLLEAFAELPAEHTLPAAEAVLEALNEGGVSEPAYRELTKLGSRVVPLLTKQLKDENAVARREAAIILGRIGSPAEAALPKLVAALKDEDHSVRQAAAQALGLLGKQGKDALPALREAMQKDSHNLVRHKANVAVAQIEGKPIPADPAVLEKKSSRPAAVATGTMPVGVSAKPTNPAGTKPTGSAPAPKATATAPTKPVK